MLKLYLSGSFSEQGQSSMHFHTSGSMELTHTLKQTALVLEVNSVYCNTCFFRLNSRANYTTGYKDTVLTTYTAKTLIFRNTILNWSCFDWSRCICTFHLDNIACFWFVAKHFFSFQDNFFANGQNLSFWAFFLITTLHYIVCESKQNFKRWHISLIIIIIPLYL